MQVFQSNVDLQIYRGERSRQTDAMTNTCISGAKVINFLYYHPDVYVEIAMKEKGASASARASKRMNTVLLWCSLFTMMWLGAEQSTIAFNSITGPQNRTHITHAHT